MTTWSIQSYSPSAVALICVGDWKAILITIGLALRDLERAGRVHGGSWGTSDREAIRVTMTECATRHNTDLKRVFQVLRLAVTGKESGLGMYDVIEFLGINTLGLRIVFAIHEL